jgi:lipopolysaccharide transport system permease protein
MQTHRLNPSEIVKASWRNRGLLAALIKRDIAGRYRGSALGLIWTFLNPCILLIVYAFVFGTIFKSQWSAATGTKADFALILFAGLIVFNIFAELMTRSPHLVVGNPNYVKKVIFPIELLPGMALGTALFHAGGSFLIWLVGYGILCGLPSATILLAPVVLLPLLFFCLGLSWFLAALGVYLRDIGQLMSLVVTVSMFLSSIFYPVSALPEQYRPWVMLSPITVAVEQFREVVFFGALPDWRYFFAQLVLGSLVLVTGFAWFQKTRKGFADVI